MHEVGARAKPRLYRVGSGLRTDLGRQLGWHAVPTLPRLNESSQPFGWFLRLYSILETLYSRTLNFPGGGEGIDCATLGADAPILRIACSPIRAHRTQAFSSLQSFLAEGKGLVRFAQGIAPLPSATPISARQTPCSVDPLRGFSSLRRNMPM